MQQFLNGVSSSCENVEANLSTVFNSVRGTKQYWYMRNSEIKCMIREWGSPTLFLTLSCAQYESPEIIDYLKKSQQSQVVSFALKIRYLCPENFRKSFFQTVLIKCQVLGEILHFFWKKRESSERSPSLPCSGVDRGCSCHRSASF